MSLQDDWNSARPLQADWDAAKPVTAGSPAPKTEDQSMVGRAVSGAIEPNLALLSGAVATPVAGIAGLASAPFVGAEKAGDIVKSTQKAMTYEPRYQGGKAAMEVIGYPFEKLSEAAHTAGNAVYEKTGSTELAALTKTIIEAVPQLFAAKGAGKAGEIPSLKKLAGVEEKPLTKQQTAVREVQQQGYAVSPTQAKPTLINRMMEGWAGSSAASKEFSIKNQPLTNATVKKGLGIPAESEVDYASIDSVIQREGQAYNAVREVPIKLKLTDQFTKEADELMGRASDAAKRWPDRFKLQEVEQLRQDMMKAEGATPNEVIDLVRHLRKQASLFLKTKDDPVKMATGEAYRLGADSLDELLDQNLRAVGKADLVSKYQKARKTIAQAYDVRAATNDFTGNVDANHLLKLSEKRPFTDYLKDIAKAASVNKKGMRTPEQVGAHPGWTPLEAGIAAGELTSGNIPFGSVLMARPLISKIIASGPYQKRFVGGAGKESSSLAQRLLQLIMAGGANATEER